MSVPFLNVHPIAAAIALAIFIVVFSISYYYVTNFLFQLNQAEPDGLRLYEEQRVVRDVRIYANASGVYVDFAVAIPKKYSDGVLAEIYLVPTAPLKMKISMMRTCDEPLILMKPCGPDSYRDLIYTIKDHGKLLFKGELAAGERRFTFKAEDPVPQGSGGVNPLFARASWYPIWRDQVIVSEGGGSMAEYRKIPLGELGEVMPIKPVEVYRSKYTQPNVILYWKGADGTWRAWISSSNSLEQLIKFVDSEIQKLSAVLDNPDMTEEKVTRFFEDLAYRSLENLANGTLKIRCGNDINAPFCSPEILGKFIRNGTVAIYIEYMFDSKVATEAVKLKSGFDAYVVNYTGLSVRFGWHFGITEEEKALAARIVFKKETYLAIPYTNLPSYYVAIIYSDTPYTPQQVDVTLAKHPNPIPKTETPPRLPSVR